MPKQMEVPGTERVEIPEIRTAAELLADIREERANHRSRTQTIEDERRAELIEVMKKHGVKQHVEPDGLTIELKTKTKVKVTRPDTEGDNDNVAHLAEAKAKRREAERGTQDIGHDVEP